MKYIKKDAAQDPGKDSVVPESTDTGDDAQAAILSLLDEALALADEGVKVFPCHRVTDDGCTCMDPECKSPGKHPRTKDGSKGATTDEKQIREWWTKWGKYNRLNFGQTLAGRAVVDIDVAEGKPGEAVWADLSAGQDTPDTLTYRTGRKGTQYVFKLPEGQQGGSPDGYSNSLGEAVDFKTGPHAYVMVPGSKTDGVYTVTHDAPSTLLPAWIAKKARTGTGHGNGIKGTGGGTFKGWSPEALEALPADDYRRGNDWLAALAGHYARDYRNDRTTYLTKCVEANEMSDDPIHAGDFRKTTESIWSREQAKQATGTEHRGQLRMAERFVSEHGESLRHVHSIGWHRWDGARWAEDKGQVEIRAAVETVKAALHEAVELSGGARDDLMKDARKSESAGGLDGMIRIAGAMVPLTTAPTDLDANPYLFNTPGGTIDLATSGVRDNDRADLLTKVAGTILTGELSADWDAFLKRVLPDEDVRAFVQRLTGYAMLGKVTEHIMPIFTGTGANGKGTFRDAVAAAFGDYAIEVDPAILMESKHERHGAFKMRLRGARLVFCSETEKDRKFAEATMKRLVGGDPIEANLMHKNPITFDPSHTLVMLTNHLPAVSGDDPAVWRRILVVPFDVVIPEEERDGSLPERLKAAAPAVLAWAHQGWLEYQRIGLAPPAAVQARTAAYRDTADALGHFLDECTAEVHRGAVKARELFTAWTAWCLQNGEQPGSEVSFAESMKSRGFEKGRGTGGVRQYKGLTLDRDGTPKLL